MDEEERLDFNFDEGKQRIKDTIKRLDESIKKMKNVADIITYKVDGEVILSIIKKLEKSKEQSKYMLSRFDKLQEGIIVPWKLIKRG